MLHILLIEDNPGDVRLVREGLRSCSRPIDVVIADDGERALQILAEGRFKPDFIMLDLNLPKFSGLQFLERFCGPERPPVIVLSGSENPADQRRALEMGASEYILKPLDYQDFIEQIRAAVEKWGAAALSASV